MSPPPELGWRRRDEIWEATSGSWRREKAEDRGGVEGRMEESDWIADWVLERESDGIDVKGVGSDVPARLVVVSEVGVSSDIERD